MEVGGGGWWRKLVDEVGGGTVSVLDSFLLRLVKRSQTSIPSLRVRTINVFDNLLVEWV